MKQNFFSIKDILKDVIPTKNILHIILMIPIINNHINDFSFGQNNKLSIIYFHT